MMMMMMMMMMNWRVDFDCVCSVGVTSVATPNGHKLMTLVDVVHDCAAGGDGTLCTILLTIIRSVPCLPAAAAASATSK
jgi:hypothetical protein